MAFLRRMTAEHEEMILAGAAPAGDSDTEVADFVMALRAALPAQAPDEVTAVTVPRLAQAARIGALEADAPTRDPGGAAAAGTAPASATLGRPRPASRSWRESQSRWRCCRCSRRDSQRPASGFQTLR